MPIAIYHLSIKIVRRNKGKSAVAAAAYRAGEKITNEYDGVTHDFTCKGGLVHTEILLPENAPAEYSDQAILWNAVEKIEKAKNSQLAREIEIALPVELTREQSTDWNEQTKAEEWRQGWSDLCNQYLEQNNHTERIDHRSYERQEIDQIPVVHLGMAASAMEKRGIKTERGNINREIELTNKELRQLKGRIVKLQDWLKEETESAEPYALSNHIEGLLALQAQAGKSERSQSLYNLKDASNMLNFLTVNKIMDMDRLNEKFKSLIGEQFDIQQKLKPIDKKITSRKKHIEQSDIYLKYKGKKAFSKAE